MEGAFVYTPTALKVARVTQLALEEWAREREGVTLLGTLPAAMNVRALRAQAAALIAQPGPEPHSAVAARVAVVAASGEQPGRVVAAGDIEAGTVVMPVTGRTMTSVEAKRLRRASLGGPPSYFFATAVTEANTPGFELVVSAAPTLNLIAVASRDSGQAGNIAVIDAVGAGSCGSRVAFEDVGAAGEPAAPRSLAGRADYGNLRLPFLLCVATRRIRQGEELLFEADTEFWHHADEVVQHGTGPLPAPAPDARAAQPEEHDVPETQTSGEDFDAGVQAGMEPPASADGGAWAAPEMGLSTPLKRHAPHDADVRSVRACIATIAQETAGLAQRTAAARVDTDASAPSNAGDRDAMARELRGLRTVEAELRHVEAMQAELQVSIAAMRAATAEKIAGLERRMAAATPQGKECSPRIALILAMLSPSKPAAQN